MQESCPFAAIVLGRLGRSGARRTPSPYRIVGEPIHLLGTSRSRCNCGGRLSHSHESEADQESDSYLFRSTGILVIQRRTASVCTIFVRAERPVSGGILVGFIVLVLGSRWRRWCWVHVGVGVGFVTYIAEQHQQQRQINDQSSPFEETPGQLISLLCPCSCLCPCSKGAG